MTEPGRPAGDLHVIDDWFVCGACGIYYRDEHTCGATPAQDIAAISRMLDASYPPDLDPEAHLWRRVTKITEECGEVDEALRGYVGENPRKGQTHTRDDVVSELLDVAGAALGAVEHLTGNHGASFRLLADKLTLTRQRLVDADLDAG